MALLPEGLLCWGKASGLGMVRQYGSLPGNDGIRSHRRRGDAAVDHDGLAGHEARGIGAEIGHRTGDFVGFADPPQRRGGAAALQALFVLPQRHGKIGLDEAGRDAIDAHAFRAPFAGKAAAQPKMPRLEPVMTATLPVRSNGVFFTRNPFVIPGWSEGPGPESRDSGLALRAPRNDDGGEAKSTRRCR